MAWALIVHESSEWGKHIAGYLRHALPGTSVEVVGNVQAARDALAANGTRSCKVIVSSVCPPLDADQAPALVRGAPTIPDLLHACRDKHHHPPCVLLLDERDVDAPLRSLPNTALRWFSELAHLTEAVHALLPESRRNRSGQHHDIDVDISMIGDIPRWCIRGTHSNPLKIHGSIKIRPEDLERLQRDSRSGSLEGHGDVCRLGKEMYEHLFANNRKSSNLELQLAARTDFYNRLEAVRFSFHMDNQTNGLLVETLAKPSASDDADDPDFWMLRSPIFRKYGQGGTRQPLFKDRRSRKEPINCLLILGHSRAFNAPSPIGVYLPDIPRAKQECEQLADLLGFEDYEGGSGNDAAKCEALKQRRTELRIDRACMVRPRDAKDTGASHGAVVRQVLGERQWHMIHYIGHSELVDGKGYLVLGPKTDDLIPLAEFATLANQAQFVFLNSCHSGNAGFVTQLMEAQIPAVAGYTSKIDDQAARIFSEFFYKDLFNHGDERGFLEYAFMRAKNHLFGKFAKKTLWTAPLLFMHAVDAEHELPEGYHEVYHHELQHIHQQSR